VLARDHPAIRPTWPWVLSLTLTLLIYTAIGIAARVIIDLVRRRRDYRRRIRRRAWIVETLRLNLAGGLTFYVYGWIKLAMPVVHPVLFDQELWNLDTMLFLGMAPTVFFLDVLGNDLFLRGIDWTYSYIFYASTIIATSYFFSHPSRRIRLAFANGNGLMWLAGAWLYMLVPSLGPAYRFPDVWLTYDHVLSRTQFLQAMLMRNYQNVLRAARGLSHGDMHLMFGIAAFPSLHVAFQTYVFLWMRRLWTSGEVLFGIFAAAIFLGSMITGWHYLIDGLAGLALGLVCWWVSWRQARMARFLRLL
jgi:hypothetical protein